MQPDAQPEAVAGDRLARAAEQLADAGLDALVVGPSADLRYLAGYDPPPLERPTLLVVRRDGAHALIVPRLERELAEHAGVPAPISAYAETDDPFALARAQLDGLGAAPAIGLGDQLWARFVLALQQALPRAQWTRAAPVIRELRIRKTGAEVAALRRAAEAIDAVHGGLPEVLRPGRSEAEVAREIGDRILAAGHEQVNFVIVGSGPNGASPHHHPGERRLAAGDAVVIDIGGTLAGYCSDCTRNYVLDEAEGAFGEAHAVLEAAQQAACAAVAPGVAAERVDRAAREVITEAGYGEHFIHRTGHGIGLEEHEEPYIVEGNTRPLEPGMVFSIEPGIYLPGRFGMRIEDIVAVTEDGIERLNRLDRAPVRV